MINIYTDGSSRGNPGPGGYGIVMLYKGQRKELSQGYRLTTNNRMELMAVIKALEALKNDKIDITIYSDSKYVVDAVEKKWVFNWKKKEFKGKKNSDLWNLFLDVYETQKIKFFWIKGHNNHPQNERCDHLAFEASKSDNLDIDHEYERQ